MKRAISIALALCLGAAFAADEFALPRAEFVKYYRQITGKEVPEGIVKFAIDPKVSKSGRDAYTLISGTPPSGWRASVPANAGRASSPAPLTITGSNLRSVWYGLYDLLERRGGCHWFWDGDVVPKRDSIDLSNLDVHEEAHFEYRAIRYFAHRGLTRFQAEHWGLDDWKKEIDWLLKRSSSGRSPMSAPIPIPPSRSPALGTAMMTARSSGASSIAANCATTSRSTPLRAG